MRLSFIEVLCLAAIGTAMVELHDNHRFMRPGSSPATALATAAKPAADAGGARSPDVVNAVSTSSYR